MTPALEVHGLRKCYPGRDRREFVAVDGLDFEVERGACLAVVGESGSGKTTTARMVIGQERPTSGRIVLEGQDWTQPTRSSARRRERGALAQIVFQDPYTSLDPRQRVGASIEEVLRLHTGLDRAARERRVLELCDSVGLDARHRGARPADLSGGQRQRVAIARALAAAPSVLVLDEAVSALDVSIQAQVLTLLRDIRSSTHVAMLFISHDLAVVRQIADDVLVMHRGRAVEQGSTGAVLDRPQHDYTKALRASVPRPGWLPVRRDRTVV